MKPPQKLIPILLAAGLLSGGTALAGSFTTDFSSISGFTAAYNPTWNTYPIFATNRAILTPAMANYGSGIVIQDLDAGQPIESFVATFKLQLGPGSGNPADGVSFNFGSNIIDDGVVNYAEEGPGGQCLTISFDPYVNSDVGETSPSIDIKFRGQYVATHPLARADLVTSQLEDVRVELKANGRVTVTYKGQIIHDNVFVPGWGPIAGLFSFAARCGGENEYQAIANLSINTVLQSATVVAPTILANPLSGSVPEGGSTNFTVSADGTAPLTFQWTKNGADITGATGTSLTYGPVSYAADNNAQIACKVSNAANTVTSGNAILTVIKDTTPPTVTRVGANTAGTEILVTFSEPVSDTATVSSNYRLAMGTTDLQLSFINRINANTVDIFVFTPMPQGREFTLTINGVQDMATSPPNTIAANTQVTFRSFLFQAGAVLHKKYGNLDNNSSSLAALQADPRYPNFPDRQDIMSMFEYPANGAGRDEVADPTGRPAGGGDNTILFSDTLECLFTPATTGDYVFHAGGADINDVYLSTDDQPANMVRIAQCSGWTNPRDWDVSQCGTTNGLRSDWYTGNMWVGAGSPSTGEAYIHLEQGVKYYLFAFHHRYTWSGGDDFAVTYTFAGSPAPASGAAPLLTGNLVGTYLDPTGANVNFELQPADASIDEGQKATFTVAATGQSAYGTNVTYQWQTAPAGSTTFTNIPGATTASFTTPAMALTENGRTYQVVASVPGYSSSSRVATLTVHPDATPPQVVNSGAIGNSAGTFDLTIAFNESLDSASAIASANYSVSAGTISAIKYIAGQHPLVTMKVSGLTAGSSYSATVANVADLFNNKMSSTTLPFTVPTMKWGVVGADELAIGNAVVPVGNNGFDVYSDGIGEWGTYDEATFVYEQITGDFDKEVRVEYQDASSQWARAGLIARDVPNFGVNRATQATQAGRYQKNHVNPVKTAMGTGGNNSYECNRRLLTGGPTDSPAGGGVPAYPNAWIRLQRVGQTFTMYRGTDGVNWTVLGTSTFDGTLPDALYVGPEFSPENGNVSPAALQSMFLAKYRDYRTHSDVVPAPVMTFQRTPTGMTITYEAGSTLQWAPTPGGAWTDLTGAANPYVVPVDNQPKFYRAKK